MERSSDCLQQPCDEGSGRGAFLAQEPTPVYDIEDFPRAPVDRQGISSGNAEGCVMNTESQMQNSTETNALIASGPRKLEPHNSSSSDGETSPAEIKTTSKYLASRSPDENPPSRLIRAVGDIWDEMFLDSWALELLSLGLAACCIIAIVIVLHIYDGRPLPHWQFGITINSFIGLFSTLARAALIYPVSQALSQLKWIWYSNRNRSAVDLEQFDQASRGPLGSLKLLFCRQSLSLASLGAIITIFAFAASPVTQQAVKYVPKSILNGTDEVALSLRSSYYNALLAVEGNTVPAEGNLDQATQAAIFAGILAPANSTIPHLALSCSTANCDWPLYKTLGVCASIADISHLLMVECSAGYIPWATCIASLPGGPTMKAELGGLILDSYSIQPITNRLGPPAVRGEHVMEYPLRGLPSQAFEDVLENTFLDFYVIWAGNDSFGPTPPFKAAEINFQYCIQTLQSKVEKGKSYTDVVDWDTAFQTDFPDGLVGGLWTASSNGSREKFSVDLELFTRMCNKMAHLFFGSYILSTDNLPKLEKPAAYAIVSAIKLPPYGMAGLRTLAGNLATSMTNNIRRYKNGSPATGQATVTLTYVEISWPWLTLIGALIFSSFIFLLLVMIIGRRRKHKLWKSSNVALAYAIPAGSTAHSLDFEGLKDNNSMKKQAERAQLRLVTQDGVTWQLEPLDKHECQ